MTTVSAAIDGGQPWRRSVGDNVTYTDWRRDSYFTALKDLLPGIKRLGVEIKRKITKTKKEILS